MCQLITVGGGGNNGLTPTAALGSERESGGAGLIEDPAASAACFRTRDYFLNYFGLGLDLLVDGNTSRIRKIVVHTNVPGHPEFGHYNKCNFELVFRGSGNKSDDNSGGELATRLVVWLIGRLID
jgi:hypothetical protein